MSRDSTRDSLEYRLCSWELKTGQLNEKIFVLKQYPIYITSIYWPLESRIFVVRFSVPHQLMLMACWSNPYQNLAAQWLTNLALLPTPGWYESYQLAEEAGQPPKLLARWTPEYWNSWCDVSPDGRWAVFPEPWGDEKLAYVRAKASGRTTFRGKELAELFRSSTRGIRVYDTSTGKFTRHYQDTDPIHPTQGWLDNNLVITSYRFPDDAEMSLETLREGAANVNLNHYSHTAQMTSHVLRLGNDGAQMLAVPTILKQPNSSFYSNGRVLVATQLTGAELMVREGEIQGQEVIFKQSARFPGHGDPRWVGWLPGTGQYVALAGSIYYRVHLMLGERWPWLDLVLRSIDPLLSKSGSVVVGEQKDGSVRECRIHQDFVDQAWARFSNLYLIAKSKSGSITLNCYAVPLTIYSPWWGHGAALVPFLVLVIVLWIIRHRRVPTHQHGSVVTR